MKQFNLTNAISKHLKGSSKELKLIYVLLSFFLVVLICILLSPSKDTNNYKLGIQAFNAQKWSESLKYFEAVIDKNKYEGIEATINKIKHIQDSIKIVMTNMFYSKQITKAKILLSEKKYDDVVSLLKSFPTNQNQYTEADSILSEAYYYYNLEIVPIEVGKEFVCKNCGRIMGKETKFINVIRKDLYRYQIIKIPKGLCDSCLASLQKDFESMRSEYSSEYDEQGNDILKSQVFNNVIAATNKFVKDINFTAQNWSGTIDKIETPFMGSTDVSLTIISDNNGKMIKYQEYWPTGNITKGTKVYDQLLNMQEGDHVKFDFKFKKDWNGNVHETSLQEATALEEPAFSVHFLSISK